MPLQLKVLQWEGATSQGIRYPHGMDGVYIVHDERTPDNEIVGVFPSADEADKFVLGHPQDTIEKLLTVYFPVPWSRSDSEGIISNG